MTNTLDSLKTTYRCDYIGQITSESRTGYSGSYTYDANGNRLTRTVGGVTENYAYDDADKLQDVKIGGVTQKSYSYDTAGRTTSIVSSAGTTSLSYDYEGRVTGITYPNSSTNSFSYNGMDTRVGKTDSTGTATYKRDGASVVAAVLSDGSATYTPGISERRSTTTTYLHSGMKNADSQSGTGQTLGASRQYDAFGNLTASSGTWKGPFGYAGAFGYQEDPDSSLKLLGHRYYDSSTGRFLTRDPAKDGRNWYGYCGNSPISSADPNGLFIKEYLHLFWTLPNQIIGGLGSLGGQTEGYDEASDAIITRGGWLANTISMIAGENNAVTIGNFIMYPDKMTVESVIDHERVHVDQSNKLGPLYLLAIGAGYLVSAANYLDFWEENDLHDGNPLEADADARSGNIEFINGNHLVRQWVEGP